MTSKTRAPPRGPPRHSVSGRKSSTAQNKTNDQSGLEARHLAVDVLSAVLDKKQALDDALAKALAKVRWAKLAPRDRAFARLVITTVLRRHAELAAVTNTFLAKPLPQKSSRARIILHAGAAQLLMLDTPPHAAINLSVELVRKDKRVAHLDKLINAVLRRVAAEGRVKLSDDGPAIDNIPEWMRARWRNTYGADAAAEIARASLTEAPLDITAKAEAAAWAQKLGGVVLATGSIRVESQGRVDQLPGFAEGAWWVQDAAAALPARLLGDVTDAHVADLCAAPGGKTAQLAAMGARVTAVELRPERLHRLKENLDRLGLSAECIAADVTSWSPGSTFDGVLLDAPCTATGTLRRHPDILHVKRPSDLTAIVQRQRELLAAAARLVKPGGRLVYCTCSLEPEEGEHQIESLLAAHPEFRRVPVAPEELGIEPRAMTTAGELRTLPFHMPRSTPPAGGLDGFFAARLERQS